MAEKNMIGLYGPWAAGLLGKGPASLSFLNEKFKSPAAWKKQAKAKALDLLAIPRMAWKPGVRVEKRFEYDGLAMERLSWQLPYGPRTSALFMKPLGAKGRLPAILALHDHGGNKYFGVEKISRASEWPHPMMREHQDRYYSGRAWANEMAKQGYAVLVPDAFLFASRRVRYADVSKVLAAGRREPDPASMDSIREYNNWASGHETIMAKSLFCAGTTWPGLFLYDDQRALDILCSRPGVDARRVGCGGLSGGGLRTVFLAGLDSRIKCAAPVGFMSTWRDFILNKCHTHTWMLYVPHLPRFLDFPEILGLRAPLPTLVLNDSQDQLFTLKEMGRADRILKGVFRKAGAPGNYRCSFHPGPHKFDKKMQEEAFAWFDRHLKT